MVFRGRTHSHFRLYQSLLHNDYLDPPTNPLLAGYLSDQYNLVDSIETDEPTANPSAERISNSSSYSDSPDSDPGMNNPAELVPPSLVSGTLMTKL